MEHDEGEFRDTVPHFSAIFGNPIRNMDGLPN